MGESENRLGFFDHTLLSLAMIYVWTESEMWNHSLWVNETDAMSFAEHGISGFGYGYGGFVFLLHVMWKVFPIMLRYYDEYDLQDWRVSSG